MAEVVGLAASVATLCELAKKAYEIGRDFHDAPAEICRVLRETVQLSTHSSLICEVYKQVSTLSQSSNDPSLLDLCRSLDLLKEDIDNINALLRRIVPKNNRGSRMRWVLLCKKDVARLLDHLHHCKLDLITTLSLALCLGYCNRPLSTHLAHSQHEPQIQPIRSSQSGSNCGGSASASALCDVGSTSSIGRASRSWPTRIDKNCFNECLSAVFSMTVDEQSSTYGISVLLMLPFQYTVSLNVILRFNFAKRIRPVLLNGNFLNVGRFVDSEQNEFMIACRRGDVLTMKYLIQNRLANINDTASGGKVPLYMAVRSGKVEAVELLLQQGASANSVYGLHQTSPLASAIQQRHLAIAELLLSYGAHCDYTTAWGWSPLWYLWADIGLEVSPPSREFIELLAGRDDFSLSHLDLVDIQGYGVIHHAVIFGQPCDVISLIDRGVSPYVPAGILEIDAIENAVVENRPDMVEALLPYYRHRDINQRDKRGWTLLHTSASEGHDTITRQLLRLGADWQALSKPSYFELADCLHGKKFTPADAAMGTGGIDDGQRRKDLFLRAVEEVKGISVHVFEPVVEADEIWFDAMEKLPAEPPLQEHG